MNREAWIEEQLAQLRAEHAERRTRVYPSAGGKIVLDGREFLNFSCNDYLGLSKHPRVIAAAKKTLDEYGAGATASRLVTGTLPVHEELEQRLASFKGYPAALVLGSGFLTNAGVIPSLVGREDTVFADKLVHASVIDAITLSRATLARFRHNDVQHLEELLNKNAAGRRLVVTESVFSMDGDLAPLPEIAAAASRCGAMLMIDEAHATGVFGPSGSGLIRKHRLESSVNVSMGTLSKAMGSYGGFVACSSPMRELFVNRARALIYTTALPPSVVASSVAALEVLQAAPEIGLELLRRAESFRKALKQAGLDTLQSASQIIPIIVGENAKALALAERLRASGILAVAIRPPTVPQGSARLRLSITLDHTESDLARAAELIIDAAKAEGVI
jgi:8-amino-7-oxononanoate synthase